MNNDETTELKLKFDAQGLLNAVIVDASDYAVLMPRHSRKPWRQVLFTSGAGHARRCG
jgi:hypothetical protein